MKAGIAFSIVDSAELPRAFDQAYDDHPNINHNTNWCKDITRESKEMKIP